MKKEILTVFLLFFGGAGIAFCQVPDSLSQSQPTEIQADTIIFDTLAVLRDTLPPTLAAEDTTTAKKRSFLYRTFKADYPNPKKALLLSLAIPGAGQLYNKRWWKLPFVWGGYAGLIIWADDNRKNYRLFRDAYIAELNGEEHPFSNTRLQANDLLRLRDQYDKSKQLSYILIFALHLVQGAEAFVDCHLKTFDVSDDLSLELRPSMQAMPDGGQSVGVGISFVLK